MIGTVRVVRDERQGGEVTGFGSLYETVTVDDATDFTEDGGQFVGPDGTVYDYDSVDFDANTLSGSVGFATALDVDDWIAPWSGDHENTERVAEVDVTDGPPLVVVVPHALRGLLPPGNREPGTGEQVDVQEPDLGTVEIRDVLGQEARLVGVSIDVPDTESPTFSVDPDGAVTALGLIGVAIQLYDTTFTTRGVNLSGTNGTLDGFQFRQYSDFNDPPEVMIDGGVVTFGTDTNLYRNSANVLKTDDQFRAVDGVASHYVNAAGRTNGDDADFVVTPPNGTIYTVRNSSNGNVYLCARANGAWKSVQLS